MRYNEIKCDLFSLGPEYYLAHCISADFALGAGIAVQFNRRFDLHKRLKAEYPRYILVICGMSFITPFMLEMYKVC